MGAQYCPMHAISEHRPHRLRQDGRATIVRLLARLLVQFEALAARVSAHRSSSEHFGADDDIGWEDGEPAESADRS